MQTENILKWNDTKDIAIDNIENIHKLHFIIQTEQKGVTAGVTIGTGSIGVEEIELFSKTNPAGKI
jgi:hypothetical protein